MRAAEPQRIFNPGLIALAYGSNKNALSEEEISKIKSTATPWPPNAQPKGTYIVSAGYSSFIFDYVYLPAGFRLSLDHDVQGINWQVRLLEFGVGASFDISAAPPPPFHMQTDVSNPFPPPHTWPEPPAQPDMPGQPYYHRPGAPGLPGLDGHPGNAGRPLYWLVTSQVMKGSLWIITNGGSGGPGGKGGKGQLGGGDRCDGVGYSDGGDGGRGGRGGDGGKGGPTSTVQIQINSLPTGFILRPDATAGYCGSASSPAPWTEGADDGRIVVWGAPGCGGYNEHGGIHGGRKYGGYGGPGGGGGGTGRQCGTFIPPVNYYTHPGKPGASGDFGDVGAMGDAGTVEIVGP